ncbi:hypothetical protein FQN54_004650 [Arachnomyces sp. PD_36]|nr:hypothetical protein FQN54_004650 [Arachnomyces sp. PD_36]
MAAGNPQNGYVGNLTEEQEGKLRELWAATFKIFNIATVDEHITPIPSQNGTGTPSTDETTDKKKSKKKFGIFNRKGDSSTESGETASTSSSTLTGGLENMKISDADDKFGESKDFINALTNQSPEDLRTTFWNLVKHDHPDALLLRFLRARKWDVQKALIMMVSTIQWRLDEMHVDDVVVKHGEAGALKDCSSSDPTAKENGEGFMAQLRLGKSFLHGTDKQGRPMCFIRVRLHKQGEQSETSLERFTVHVIETARLMLLPPVETATIVFDMTDFSLANMDYAPVKFMVKCFEANYPECLGVVLIHKAPWLFSGIWSIIKGWLDPVVAAKIQFTKTVDQLEEFIPRNHIPKDLGGDEDFTYEYIEPQPNENAQMEDTDKRDGLLAQRDTIILRFHEATLSWMSAAAKNDKEKCAALQKERSELVAQLFDAYWKLDPFLRARSLYDRQGLIQSGGKIDFYPTKEKANGGEAPAEKAKDETPQPSENDLD